MTSDSVVRAALFPIGDLLPPPDGHPDRLVEVAGIPVKLSAEVHDGLVFPEDVEDFPLHEVLREVRERLQAEERTRGVWMAPEAARPAGLAERLRALGLTPHDSAPFEARYASMAVVTAPPAGPSDVAVKRVANLEELREAERVAAVAFGLDEETANAYAASAERSWQFDSKAGDRATFVATIDDEVVGFARAAFGRTAVYLGGGATHPDFRGRGLYRALVRARWNAAVARGTPVLTVGAGSMSRPVLERLGFSIVGWADCLVDELSA